MDVIDKVFALMAQNGITAAKLAREAGITNSLITQWKQRKQKPSAENIAKIAAYFGVSVDYLLGIGQEDGKTNPATLEGQPEDEVTREIMSRFANLTSDDKVRFLDYLELLESREKL